MMKIRLAASAAASLAMLAACAASLPEPVDRAPTPAATLPVERDAPVTARPLPPAPQQSAGRAYQAGPGVVESAVVVSLPSASAAAGATAAGPTMAYRVKMGDGSTQSVVQAGERFSVGDRVQITGEGRLVRR